MGKRQEIQLDLFSEQSDKFEDPPTSPEYRIACSVDILPGLSLRSQQAGRPGIPTALGGFRRAVASVGSCC